KPINAFAQKNWQCNTTARLFMKKKKPFPTALLLAIRLCPPPNPPKAAGTAPGAVLCCPHQPRVPVKLLAHASLVVNVLPDNLEEAVCILPHPVERLVKQRLVRSNARGFLVHAPDCASGRAEQRVALSHVDKALLAEMSD